MTDVEDFIWKSSKISPSARVLWLACKLSKGTDSPIFFDLEKHSIEVGLFPSSFYTGIKQLIKDGFLVRISRSSPGHCPVYKLSNRRDGAPLLGGEQKRYSTRTEEMGLLSYPNKPNKKKNALSSDSRVYLKARDIKTGTEESVFLESDLKKKDEDEKRDFPPPEIVQVLKSFKKSLLRRP